MASLASGVPAASLASGLPASLRERLRSTGGGPLPAPREGKAFVLYLLRTTFRAEENPALETALHAAVALGVPAVCLAVLEDTFPDRDGMSAGGALPRRRPTDRATAFRLEALRELGPAFEARGAALYVHVERDGRREAAALSLASRAASRRPSLSTCT